MPPPPSSTKLEKVAEPVNTPLPPAPPVPPPPPPPFIVPLFTTVTVEEQVKAVPP